MIGQIISHYKITKYEQVVESGKDYYLDFLLPLFFCGFARRDGHPLKQAFVKEYGNVKYLNGGLFYPHQVEKRYTPSPVSENAKKAFDDPGWIIDKIKIRVDSKALKEILVFLNGYSWYLDNRPMREDTDINPDVLGYIFEKYINQKELGAYYTKEDITGYISKNTIIPFILDKLRRNGFEAPDPNPMITNNEDIIGNMADYLERLQDYDTLKFLYKDVLTPLSVLDPAVGSGAFLFTALNILLPIYRKVVFKLKTFRNSDRVSNPVRVDDEWLQNLCGTLDNHSEEYYLTKQIILNNLYGVDIVEEATEICKLRLFLQLASHLPNIEALEPLPDIDFNIYAGNSLVGGLSWDDLEANYTMDLFTAANRETIKKDIEKLGHLKADYKRRMNEINEQIRQLAELKEQYRKAQQLEADEEELNRLKGQIDFLEKEINGNINIGIDNPFHWFIEFNQIMEKGGFDVIIGNPPYVEYSKVRRDYQISGYSATKCGNLFGYFVERSTNLLNESGSIGLIVPISFSCTKRMKPVQDHLLKKSSLVLVSHFAERPSKLFADAEVLLNIVVARKTERDLHELFTTAFTKWRAEEREHLFSTLQYSKCMKIRDYLIPKFSLDLEKSIWQKIVSEESLGTVFQKRSEHRVYYRIGGGRYWKIFTDFQPTFILNGKKTASSRENYLFLETRDDVLLVLGVLSSSLFYWYYLNTTNCRDLNPNDLNSFPVGLRSFKPESIVKMTTLTEMLMADYQRNSQMKFKTSQKTGQIEYQEFYPRLSKNILDQIDEVLAQHYGFSGEELSFIQNYDSRFRMGEDK